MKNIFILILFTLITFTAHPDELAIPFSCYPKAIQQEFAKNGFKVDLDPNERTVGSWGFIINKGAEYVIYTYNPVSDVELSIIMTVINKPNKYWEDKWQNQQ